VTTRDDEIEQLETTFKTDTTIQNAYHLLHTTLFERGILVLEAQQKSSVSKPNIKTINRIYNKHVMPFIRDVLRNFLVYGYVVYTLVDIPLVDRGNEVFTAPVSVPPVKVLKRRVILKNWAGVWEVKSRNPQSLLTNFAITNQEDDSVFYISFMDGYEPDCITGEHRSPVKIIQNYSLRMKQLEEIHTVATVERARPTFILSHAPQTNKHEGTLTVMQQSNPQFFFKKQRMHDKEKQKVVKAVHDMPAEYGSGHPILITHAGEKRSYRPAVIDERILIEEGLEVSPNQSTMPEAQADLIEHKEDYKETVAFTMGVPYNFLSSKNRKGGAGKAAAEDVEMFQNTIGTMKRLLCNLLETIYLTQFPALKGKSDLKFDLLTTPYTSAENIQKMVDRDVISTEMGKEFSAATLGISSIHVLKGENEHLTIPVNGNEHQRGPRLKIEEERASAEKMKFEAERVKLLAEAAAIKAESTGENNEGELIEKEAELKKMEIEGKLEIMDKQMELTKVQTDAAIQKMKVAKATAIKKN
jgi:hypothetical protein